MNTDTSFITLPSGMVLNLDHVVCLTLSPPSADNGNTRAVLVTLSSGQIMSLGLESMDTIQLFREMTRRAIDLGPLLPLRSDIPAPPASRPFPADPWRATGA